jgi:type IV pilus assembly protein PilX
MSVRIQNLNYQSGSALIISLVFLLLLTIIGVTAMQSSTMQERMAGNIRDRNLAFQSAEAALRGAEVILSDAVTTSFNNSVAGYRQQVADSGNPVYWASTYNWTAGAGTNSGSAQYTETTLSGVAANPRFVIEELPKGKEVGQSVKLQQLDEPGYYRITTRAVGATTDSTVYLQAVYKR